VTAVYRAAILVAFLALCGTIAVTCAENESRELDRGHSQNGSVDSNSLGPDAQGESGSLDEEIEVSGTESSHK
jgi:hypothetical protein